MNIDRLIKSKKFKYTVDAAFLLITFPLYEIAILLAFVCILNVVQVGWVWLPLLALKLRIAWCLGDWLFANISAIVLGTNKARAINMLVNKLGKK